MPREIEKAMIDTFIETFELLPLQMKSLLEMRVTVMSKPGERVHFNQIGHVAAQKRLARNTDTPNIEVPHARRWIQMSAFDLGTIIDWEDIIEVLTDPSQEYQRAFVAALNREQDYEIVNTGMFGTTFTGKPGLTPETFPAGMDIAHGGTGFTLTKVSDAYTKLVQGTPIPADDELPELFIAWTRKQEAEFINTTEVKSVDYNTQKVLVDGRLGGGQRFYGFNYVRLEDWTDEKGTVHRTLPYAAGSPNVRTCAAWIKAGIRLNQQRKPEVNVGPRPDKSWNPGIYAKSRFGAARNYLNGAVKINVTEA